MLTERDIERITFGCGNLGGIGSSPSLRSAGDSESQALELLDCAREIGIRRFDTAKKPDPQGMLDFMAEARAAAVPEVKGRGRKKAAAAGSADALRAKREATTLDRVHAAMLLQASAAARR